MIEQFTLHISLNEPTYIPPENCVKRYTHQLSHIPDNVIRPLAIPGKNVPPEVPTPR